jgi:hypothetical protein
LARLRTGDPDRDGLRRAIRAAITVPLAAGFSLVTVGGSRWLSVTRTQRARPRPGLADRGHRRCPRHRRARLDRRITHQPHLGSTRYAKITAHKAILDIADLHRAAASGDIPPIADWDAAGSAARAATTPLTGAGMRAVQAAYESTTFVDNDLLMALDKVIVHAQNAHALTSGDTPTATQITELTGHAIRAWRQLAGLDNAREVNPAQLARELQLAG